MKGIAHFISGIAAATFIPDAVAQATDGSFILVLGGLFGLLPDTLDFRFARYLEKIDEAIDPHPDNVQPQAIAQQVANAVRTAWETDAPTTLALHTIRLGADLWRQYSLRFSPTTDEVLVRVGPVVNTAGVPLPGSQRLGDAVGRATLGIPIVHTYDDEITIDIFSGPSFRFERRDDALHVTFLPWHRRWSHSLTLASAIGLGMGLLLGPIAGLVSGLGIAIHILQDQLGHMGSNLFWPITRMRTHGLGLLHSGDALPNFLTVWIAVALIAFNLDRFSTAPRLPALPYLLAAVLLPLLALGSWYWRSRRRGAKPPSEALRQGDILAETEEIEL